LRPGAAATRGTSRETASSVILFHMAFVVQAHIDDHTMTTETAKEAFAKAIDWHVVQRLTGVPITDPTKTYSIDAFALAMALLEIAKTAVATAEQKAEGKNDAGG